MTERRRARRACIAIAASLCIACAIWQRGIRTFDAARWQAAVSNERELMLPDLLRRHTPTGLTRAQVEARLGPSELVAGHDLYTLRINDAGAWREHLMYLPRRLEVWYDANDVCTGYTVHPISRVAPDGSLRLMIQIVGRMVSGRP